jgi:hypothetical protein
MKCTIGLNHDFGVLIKHALINFKQFLIRRGSFAVGIVQDISLLLHSGNYAWFGSWKLKNL